MDPEDILKTAQRFVRNNLFECCYHIIVWDDTGTLPSGKVRELSRILMRLELDEHRALSLAANIINKEALLFAIRNYRHENAHRTRDH